MIALSGCGSEEVHENISDELYEDTKHVVEILDAAKEAELELTVKEEKTIDKYLMKYEDDEVVVGEAMTEEDKRLYGFVTILVDEFSTYTGLPTEEERYDGYREDIDNVIETGEY